MSDKYVVMRAGMTTIGPFDSFEAAEKFIGTYHYLEMEIDWYTTVLYTPEEFVSSYTKVNPNHAVD